MCLGCSAFREPTKLGYVSDFTTTCCILFGLVVLYDVVYFTIRSFVPIPIKYIDGKLYSNINFNAIPAGAEIISVNGITAT